MSYSDRYYSSSGRSQSLTSRPIVWWGHGWHSPYYWEARAWRRVVAALVSLVVLIVVIAVIAAHYDNTAFSATDLSPGDTRLAVHSSTFCESTTLSNHFSEVPVSIHLLKNKPVLSARSNFTVTDRFRLTTDQKWYWNFYLYPGSSYNLSGCLLSTGLVRYYIIKGTGNFDSWTRSSNYDYTLFSELCGGINKTDSRMFDSEDHYYFAFLGDSDFVADVKVTLSFHRLEYTSQVGDEVDSCTAPPESSCSLPIPYNSDYWFMVEAGSPPSDGNWNAISDVHTSCDARAWVYVVIVFAPLIGVLSAVTATAAVCYGVKRMPRSCPDSTAQNGTSAVTPALTLVTVHPVPPAPVRPSPQADAAPKPASIPSALPLVSNTLPPAYKDPPPPYDTL